MKKKVFIGVSEEDLDFIIRGLGQLQYKDNDTIDKVEMLREQLDIVYCDNFVEEE